MYGTMQEMSDSLHTIESRWNQLAKEWMALRSGWNDKAANTFVQTHWSDINASMIASLGVLRECVPELERLAVDAETCTF
jgi:uncharacterized protein YukE